MLFGVFLSLSIYPVIQGGFQREGLTTLIRPRWKGKTSTDRADGESCLKVNSFNLITEDFIAASLKSMRTDSDVDADAGADADTEGMRMGNGNATEPKVLGSHFVGGPQDLLGNH